MQNIFLEDINQGKKPTVKRMIAANLLFIVGSVVSVLAFSMILGIIVGVSGNVDILDRPTFISFFQYIGMILSTGGGILGIFLLVKYYEKREIKTLGFYRANALKQYAIGFIGALISMVGIALILMLTNQVEVTLKLSSISGSGILLAGIILLAWIIQGASEEILCRGYLLPALTSRFNVYVGIIGSSIIFSLLHLGNSNISVIALINLFLVGVVFALIAIKQKSLWGACAYHTAWNLVQGNVLGIEVSGIVVEESIWQTKAIGSPIWTGGAFGVEGSLLTLLVLLGTIIGLIVLIRKESLEHIGEIEDSLSNEITE